MECTGCHTDNPDGAKYCRSCGAVLNIPFPTTSPSHLCDACGLLNPSGSRFCKGCGVRMSPQQLVTPNDTQHLQPMAASPPSVATVQRQVAPVNTEASKKLLHFCKRCGTAILADSISCKACQADLASGESSRTPEPIVPASTFTTAEDMSVLPMIKIGGMTTQFDESKSASAHKTIVALIVVILIGAGASGAYFLNSSVTKKVSQQAAAPVTSVSSTHSGPVGSTLIVPASPPPKSPVVAAVGEVPGTMPGDVLPPKQASTNPRTALATDSTTTAVQPPKESPTESTPRKIQSRPESPVPGADATSNAARDQTGNWHDALKAEIATCSNSGLALINRLICVERAKWKYCFSDRWGTVPECTGAKESERPERR